MSTTELAMRRNSAPLPIPRALFIIMLCSLFVISCNNPFMEQILRPKTASFESNGGSPVADQSLLRGETIHRPADPVKGGYYFTGWYRDNDNFVAPWNFNLVPSGNITLYARWEADVRVTGITLVLQDFIDHAPSLAAVRVSITGTGHPQTVVVSVDPSGFDANPPVAWAISGTNVTGTGPSFTVDATDTRYNTVGTRQLTVRVYRDGIPYQGTVLVHIYP